MGSKMYLSVVKSQTGTYYSTRHGESPTIVEGDEVVFTVSVEFSDDPDQAEIHRKMVELEEKAKQEAGRRQLPQIINLTCT